MSAGHRLGCWMVLGVVLAVSQVPRTAAAADEEWMSTPYRAMVWLALPQDQETRNRWADRLTASLRERCKSHFGAAVKCEIAPAPQPIAGFAIGSEEAPALDAVGAPDDEIWQQDKLFFVVVRRQAHRLAVVARELDCRTRLWGPAFELANVELSRLDREVAAAIFHVFRPLGRITDVEKTALTLEMRAGLLAGLSLARTIPTPGSIFYPVLRRSDRRGQVAGDGTRVVPWTVLQVQSAEGDASTADLSAAKVRCRIDSGLGAPFRARSSRRVERLGLYVTPIHPQTVFELRSKDESHAPLLGYEIHARLPNQKTVTLVGRSAWDGNVVVPRDEHPYKIYYVKHGNVTLARLPCAAGLEPTVRLELPDQRERLRAEAFINGIEDELLDVVVRREIVAAKIRRQTSKELVTAADVAKATALLDEVRQLNRADGLLDSIRSREATFSSDEKSVQRRIDLMFAKLRKSIREAISPDYIVNLQHSIEQAKLRVPESAKTQ